MKIISALLLVFFLGCSDGSSNKNYEADSAMAGMEVAEEALKIEQILEPPLQDEQKIIKTAQFQRNHF